jgi:hypothetical protein
MDESFKESIKAIIQDYANARRQSPFDGMTDKDLTAELFNYLLEAYSSDESVKIGALSNNVTMAAEIEAVCKHETVTIEVKTRINSELIGEPDATTVICVLSESDHLYDNGVSSKPTRLITLTFYLPEKK